MGEVFRHSHLHDFTLRRRLNKGSAPILHFNHGVGRSRLVVPRVSDISGERPWLMHLSMASLTAAQPSQETRT